MMSKSTTIEMQMRKSQGKKFDLKYQKRAQWGDLENKLRDYQIM